MKSKTFQKLREDFTCEHCGYFVSGNGYTNHCPECLRSKHVDIHPGDREHHCHGIMEPISLEGNTENLKVVHRCLLCGEVKRCKLLEEDNRDMVMHLMQQPVFAHRK